jgi:hypothetical protein
MTRLNVDGARREALFASELRNHGPFGRKDLKNMYGP